MTTCRESIDLLVEYLDGGLSPEVKAKLDEHFGGCQPCEEFLKSYRATPSLCQKAMAVKKMPAEMATKMAAFLRSEIDKKLG